MRHRLPQALYWMLPVLQFLLPSSAWALVTFEAASSATGVQYPVKHVGAGTVAERNNCGDITPSIPAGSAGDLLVALVNAREASATVTKTGTWNTLFSATYPGQDFQVAIYWRVATGGDVLTVSQSGTCRSIAAQVARFSGVDTAAPFDGAAGALNQKSGSITTGTVTTSYADSMLLVAAFISDDRTVAAATGWGQSFDSARNLTPDLGLSLHYERQLTAGDKSIAGWDMSGAGSDLNYGVIFALKPAVPGKSITIPAPAGTAPNDLLVASISVRHFGATVTAPAGWTLVQDTPQASGAATCNSGTTAGIRTLTYWKLAGASEPEAVFTYSSTCNDDGFAAGGMLRFSGVDTSSPTVTSAEATTASATTHQAPALTPGIADTMLITVHSYGSSRSWNQGYAGVAGMDERVDQRSYGADNALGTTLAMYTQAIAGTGSTGTRTAQGAGDADYGATHSLLLRPAVSFNHIRIEHDGAALTCAPETVTVKACADANCTSLYTAGTVTTTLGPAGWQGGDTISFSGGSTTAQLWHTSAGTVTLGASATTPAPTTAARCFSGPTETCALDFADSGFVFDIPTLTACKPSGNVAFRAVKKSDTGVTCVANPEFNNKTTSVNFRADYTNPASGTQAVSVNGTAIQTGGAGTTAVNLAFDANASANITVRYPDAGRMQLTASYSQSVAGGQTLNLTGSDLFVSVPLGLAVYAGSSCAAGDATCPVFAKAGDAFNLTVKAACWTADGDMDLSDNPATPNFELTNVAISHTLVAPAAGVSGSLGVTSFDFADADNGVKTLNQSVSEVGVFDFTATPPSYLGETIAPATSPHIGRFTPHHFRLAAGASLTNRSDIAACAASTFTYLGEPFRLDYTLRAENGVNGLTQNYAGAFAKLDLTAPASLAYGAVSGSTNLTSRLNAGTSTGAWANGLGRVSGILTINRLATPDGPYANLDVGIAPTDTDGVGYAAGAFEMDVDGAGGNDHARVGRTEARFGRLRLHNAHGSELLALPVPVTLQYWNPTGGGFVTNTADTCTSLAPANFALTTWGGNLAACETSLTVSGNAPSPRLNFSAPGTGNNGYVVLRANLGAAAGSTCIGGASQPATGANMTYLQGAWTGATYDQDPSARASFGLFKNANEFIFMRENY